MYKIAVLTPSLTRGLAIAKALDGSMFDVRAFDLKNSKSTFRPDAYVVYIRRSQDLSLIPDNIFRLPSVLLFGGKTNLDESNLDFDRVFKLPFIFYDVAIYLRYLIISHQYSAPEKKLVVSDLVISLDSRRVQYKGNDLVLSNKEFSLLEFLILHQGKALTRNQILESVWDRNSNIFTNTVDVHIGKLRKKIDTSLPERFIKTIHGFGYLFRDC